MVFAWLSLNFFFGCSGQMVSGSVSESVQFFLPQKAGPFFFNVGAPEGPKVMAKLVFSLVFIFRNFSGVSRSFNDKTCIDDEILKFLSILDQRI